MYCPVKSIEEIVRLFRFRHASHATGEASPDNKESNCLLQAAEDVDRIFSEFGLLFVELEQQGAVAANTKQANRGQDSPPFKL